MVSSYLQRDIKFSILKFIFFSVKQIKTLSLSHVICHLIFKWSIQSLIQIVQIFLKNNLISLDSQRPHLGKKKKELTGNYGISEMKIAFEFTNHNFFLVEMKALVIEKLGGWFKLIYMIKGRFQFWTLFFYP